MAEDLERWKNPTRSRAFVLKYDRYHNLISEMVGPGKTITMTKEEREINQERAANDKLDIFQNGILTPIKIVDPEDQKEFAENPNLLSEQELQAMMKLSKKDIAIKLKDMTNLYPLIRLEEMMEKEDAKVTTGALEAVKERIKELRPVPQKMTSFADER